MLEKVAETRKIAESFVEARLAGQSLPAYPGAIPQDLSTAYTVQDAAIPLFPDEIVGWKVGRINTPWLEQLGAGRLVGPIFARAVQPVTEVEPVAGAIFKDGFGAAEAEFVYRLGKSPAAGQTRFTADDALALIDTGFCGFEIASSPFPGINELGPLVTISDFGNNNGLLLGPEIADWRSVDVENWTVETRINGQPVGTGKSSGFPGGAIESVRFLIENLVSRGLPVEPGMLISSGAVTGVHEVQVGAQVEARFGDHCTISCVIAEAKG